MRTWTYTNIRVFNTNRARHVGLKSALLLRQNRMVRTVEGDQARAAQRVEVSDSSRIECES